MYCQDAGLLTKANLIRHSISGVNLSLPLPISILISRSLSTIALNVCQDALYLVPWHAHPWTGGKSFCWHLYQQIPFEFCVYNSEHALLLEIDVLPWYEGNELLTVDLELHQVLFGPRDISDFLQAIQTDSGSSLKSGILGMVTPKFEGWLNASNVQEKCQ